MKSLHRTGLVIYLLSQLLSDSFIRCKSWTVRLVPVQSCAREMSACPIVPHHVSKCSRNVSKRSQNLQIFPESLQMFPESLQMFPECLQMFPEWSQMVK
jgi:hypothetical protein